MTKKDFCGILQKELGETTEINADTNFKNLESYGSLSAILVLQLIEEKFKMELNPREFRNVKSVNDLADVIGEDHFS